MNISSSLSPSRTLPRTLRLAITSLIIATAAITTSSSWAHEGDHGAPGNVQAQEAVK